MIHQIDHLTIHAVLGERAEQTPDAPAIAAPGRPPLRYRALWAQVERCLSTLNGLGIGRGDRVAIALPQGPEMAVTCLSVASGAIAVPLNPDGQEADFELLFEEVKPTALVAQEGIESPARRAALKRGISVLELVPRGDGSAGEFGFAVSVQLGCDGATFSSAKDIALLLRTSGTTSRPKIVPLTHQNVCAAAGNTRAALGLDPQDRCLDVATLFHGHGLVAGVVASIMGGASVMCPPAFDAVSFFAWFDEFKPTWYTAVPTVHQAILQEAPRHPDVISLQRLRFIRSASAYLPDAVRTELEKVFGVVVTESYGLSEALQLTNTPLDRHTRKIGSLGVPGTSGVGIMDETGRLLGPGESGEIVARGPVVMAGYLNLPDTGSDVFRDGWFRTGDVGYLDFDGHLYMTGRLKDQINRGGEKISPQEIDRVLLEHPAVSQAIAFGMAHPSLGEEVAAAVVLRSGFAAIPEEIREYAESRLQDFKVPRKVFIVPAIPSNSTGKLLRRDLAARLGKLNERPPYAAPRDALEQGLVRIWEEVLSHSPIGIDDDFFDLGGYSLLAVRLFARISNELASELPLKGAGENEGGKAMRPSLLWDAPTIRKLAQHLTRHEDSGPLARPLIEVQRGGDRIPFVMLTGDWGGLGFYVRNLARNLDAQQPVYALMPHDITAEGAPQTIEAMAEAFLPTLQAAQPAGPYLLGGYSHSGLVAFEMAKRLQKIGERVALLFVIDSDMPDPRLRYFRRLFRALARAMRWSLEEEVEAFLTWKYRIFHARELWVNGLGPLVTYYLRRFGRHHSSAAAEPSSENQTVIGYLRAIGQYIPAGFYPGRVTVISSMEGHASQSGDPTLGWSRVADDVRVLRVPGDHPTCLTEHVDVVAAHLRSCLEDAMQETEVRDRVPFADGYPSACLHGVPEQGWS